MKAIQCVEFKTVLKYCYPNQMTDEFIYPHCFIISSDSDDAHKTFGKMFSLLSKLFYLNRTLRNKLN